MKHSYSNDNTCFSIDVIDEILEEDFDALLDEDSKILHSIEGTLLEEEIFAEFDEFMAMTANETLTLNLTPKTNHSRKSPSTLIIKSRHPLKNLPRILNLNPFLIIWNMYSWKNPIFFLRMPFGLCNAPATFQRCMLAIFHDMIEESVEVFRDDFFVFGNSFDKCLNNLDKMLQRCKDAHIVLNWEKCHFMVKEGIVLGHKMSSAGLEVTKEKIDVISKLPPLLTSKVDFAVGSVLEFNIEIKDRKGTENVAVDHLSRIENDKISDDSEVDDNFLGETLMEINTKDEPWFADFANYLVADIIPKGMTYQQKNKFFSDLKHYFWEEPYLFKVCSDGMIRRCVSGPETQTILDQCHHGPTGGHYGPNVTAKKVLDSGFYWPTIIKEAHTLVRLWEACQKTGNISKRDEMPLNST
ncbi:reverse transcriptase domain-containing protein [Tanacetum coccineum]|uniref:Reverse transcriptase domain-containing protein n=1 Tax=Tanacetum coccineum TaxID=301880 RepID=A0ABQ5CTF9_9ASTR